MTTEIDAEGLRKKIESDPDEGEIGAGFEMFTPEAEVALERIAFAALPRWAQDELTALRAAATLPTPASDDQVEAVTDEMVERAALALAKRNHVPEWREFIPDARAALLAAMAYPSKKDGELEFQVSGTGELADAYRDLAARQTDTEPDIAKVVRDNRSELYMPLDDATVRSGEEG